MSLPEMVSLGLLVLPVLKTVVLVDAAAPPVAVRVPIT